MKKMENRMNMRWIKWIKGINETLLDLLLGSLLYSLFFEIIGLLFVENKLSYSAGLFLGTIVSLFMAWSMYRSLDACLDMERRTSTRSMIIRSLLRMLVMLAVLWVGLKTTFVSFAGVVIGMIGLKMAAHFHMYTNVYITKKILRKGR